MSDRRLALAILLLLLAVYTLTYSGVFHSDDEMSVAAAAESLAKRGSLTIDQLRWNQDLSGGIGKYGLDGHLYSKYGWGASLAAAPFYLAAQALPDLGAVQSAMLLNLLVTALTGTLVFLCARRLGVTQGASVAVALIFGLASLAWPYAKYFFSEPLSGLALLVAFYFLLRYRDGRTWLPLWLAGLALAGALAVKTANAAAIPLFFLLLAVYEWRPVGAANQRSLLPYVRTVVLRSLPLAAPVLLAGGITLAYNFFRFGAPLDAGYLPIEQFSGKLQEGLPGLLLSPGRGLLFYAPVLLLLIPALPTFWRGRRPEAAFIVVLAASQTLLYARWHVWFGGWCWGPRFLAPLMPFLALVLGPWLQDAWRRGCGARLVIAGLAVLSALVQVLGLSVDFNLYLWSLLALHPEMRPGIAYLTVDDPRFSPLLGQLGLLSPANLDFAWLRVSEGMPWIEWRILGPALVFVALAAVGLRACLQEELCRLLALTIVVGTVAIWQAAAWGDGRAHYGAVAQDYEAIFGKVQAESQPGDAMLFVGIDRAEILLNANRNRMPVYAPLQEKWPLKPATQSMLAGMAAAGGRLWLITEDLPDAGSGYEHWLAIHAAKLADQERGVALVTLYAFPPAWGSADAAPVERVDKLFGEALRLEGYTIRPWPAQPGQTVEVVLFWGANGKVKANYRVSLRLASPDGKSIWQRDADPQDGYAPTSGWQPGQTVVDRRGLLLPSGAAPGAYTLSIVVYDPVTGQALEAAGGGQELRLGLAVGGS